MEYEWSVQLFIAELVVIILGRFMGTIGLIKVLELFRYKSGIKTKELIFISYAGLIRGAVAFGLVLRVDPSVTNRPVIVTTTLSLVVFTTVFLGSTVATMSKALFGKEIEEKKRLEREAAAKNHSVHEDLNQSHHEKFLHPNQEVGDGSDRGSFVITGRASQINIAPPPKKVSKIIQVIKAFDQKYIKPCLIYKFNAKQQKKTQEFMLNYAKKGAELEE
jgi:NhaP-type Na+/H+ or K+/H+ antiporter